MPPGSTRQPDIGHADLGSNPESPARTWLHARARLMPNLLSQSPPWIRSVFGHSWAPMRALVEQLDCLPPHVWRKLLEWESGYVAICNGKTRYSPGPASIRQLHVTNVAFVSIEDLALANEGPLHVLGHLIDHHLGCAGRADGPWLSEGGGISHGWQEAGQRLPDLFALGYAADPVAQSSVRDYFAQSLALFCLDRQRLNVADPQIEKWLRTTIWNEGGWKDDPDP